ncbi:ABC-type transport system ATP-binding protein (probable substrate sugar) [Natrialba magadii ATCC 43099]|uniref:ABC-type D-xylose/L-arabinose transporter n=1 Tax=Natrialba magadii (strain ATCC 43099 / DSM 3394 / CCM 3739 / CIP 104546 / IAM 13178 / JCM 8861 / NBRC 102185 / NCIMB 2190 / MS3) TaxID=547559 RepID=D3SVP1_NATMM|nr:ABC transporter ATP-binding protein [Natrialba magadii]ADD03610.1 ABC-type transport system ATP-binding protein (probable substrate sugar) [Natrialba magadii ATCC 43099]ELY29055.1 ABC transporter [Natrialba magadii ATCC 43099]
MARVQLEHITKRYEDVTAVNDVSMEIEDGEFVTFVGPSGCGKSTTMETVAGLTKPTEGNVYIGDREVTNLAPKDRGVAMVFQNIALFPHMDVFENISFGLRLRKYDDEEVRRRVEQAADIVQLEGMLDRMPDEMSGGQRQRVAIARAIVRNPDVFLMDEPLANLDAKLRVHMRTELQRLHRELGTTIIYVTHDQAEAMTMSNRIAVLNEGKLQQLAPPLECYNEPANLFVAGFIGSPSMNFMEGELTATGFESENVDVAFEPELVPSMDVGETLTLGVRPEDVHLVATADGVAEQTAELGATADVLEPMGDEVFVYLLLSEAADRSMEQDPATASDQLLMSVTPDTDIHEGKDVNVVLDRSKIHLFETATGDALRHGLTEPSDGGSGPAATEADT